MSSITSFLTSSSILLLSSGFSDKPFTTLVINSPTFSNSFNPKPLVVATTRGFGLKEFEKVGELITKVVKGLSENPEDNSKIEEEVRNEVIELTSHFPIYKNLK